MLEIIINGLRPASKKNSRRNYRNISLPSKAYENFHSLVGEQLLPLRKYHFTGLTKMVVYYEIKGKYDQDCSNALASLEDCLQDYGIIEDDKLLTDEHIIKKNGFKDWRIVIQLEAIK